MSETIFGKGENQYKNCACCIYYKLGRCRNLKSDFFDKKKSQLDICDKFTRRATTWRFN